MIKRFKQMMESRAMFSKVNLANDPNTVKPFLLGCQMEYRKFGNYIFTKNTRDNVNLLEQRKFADFKQTVEKRFNWELADDLLTVGDNIMYNEKYNIMVVMVPEKSWGTLNTSVTIAEKTKKDIETQKDIVISAISSLS